MNLEAFKFSLAGSEPSSLTVYLRALWYDGKTDWEKAHNIIQDIEDRNAYWIHAYLHRKEGDPSNAKYWYNKAGKPMPGYSLEKEWEEIVNTLL